LLWRGMEPLLYLLALFSWTCYLAVLSFIACTMGILTICLRNARRHLDQCLIHTKGLSPTINTVQVLCAPQIHPLKNHRWDLPLRAVANLENQFLLASGFITHHLAMPTSWLKRKKKSYLNKLHCLWGLKI
jgi:hypothetical protein